MSNIVRKKVFVGLSGGVDSSVSAALLKKQGYEVTGVFIHVWSGNAELTRNGEPSSAQGYGRARRGTDAEPPLLFQGGVGGGDCQAVDDRLDAMRVCVTLGIPFRELNLEKEYKRDVVDYMIREYKAGKTPNPDVFCNRFIKFGAFYKWARAQGAQYIATGHYTRVAVQRNLHYPPRSACKYDRTYMLKAGTDINKDQSYFLWQIRREQLPHLLFPVGGMKKPEVRKLAKKFGLITAEKKDSQGLCFVGKVDMKEFLSHYIKPRKGEVLNEKREVIGEHNGVSFYTIGERFPLNLPPFSKGRTEGGWYVIGKNLRKNTLTLSHKAVSGELPQARKEIIIKNGNWVSSAPIIGKAYSARVRYRQPLQKCRVANTYGRRYLLLFEKAQIAAAGQSAVLYHGEICLGGGIIE